MAITNNSNNNKRQTLISPSVLAADLSCLADEVDAIERADADMVHLDVMDGMFVTNITFGLPVISSLRKRSKMLFDVHLMIEAPERYIDRFIDAGADILTFHYEACADSRAALRRIREKGCKSAISVKPKTDVSEIFPLLGDCDMVLVMTVEPGYGGQSLITETLDKVKVLKKYIDEHGLDVDIQVDGGITVENAHDAVAAGANILVAGSTVFKAADKAKTISELKNA